MRSLAIVALVAAIALSATAKAGPCTGEIASAQARFDVALKEVDAVGATAAETTGAKLHHQPTAASVEGAEKQADMMSMERQKKFLDAIDRARKEDRAGDAAACRKDIADARATLPP